MAVQYLLNEDGTKLILEDETGFLILEEEDGVVVETSTVDSSYRRHGHR